MNNSRYAVLIMASAFYAPLSAMQFFTNVQRAMAFMMGNAHQSSTDPVNGNRANGRTPLMEAAARGNAVVVKEYCTRMPETINARDSNGHSALFYAVFNNHVNVLQILIEHGALINLQSNNGYSALMCAATKGQSLTVRCLLAHGADANLQNDDGETALMHACNKGDEISINYLLMWSNTHIKDKSGKKALDYAWPVHRSCFTNTEIQEALHAERQLKFFRRNGGAVRYLLNRELGIQKKQ